MDVANQIALMVFRACPHVAEAVDIFQIDESARKFQQLPPVSAGAAASQQNQ